MSVVLHTTIDLRCVANGYPTPTVTLLRRGLPLASDVGSLTYTMHYIDEDALGVYECSATNELGTATIKIFATEAGIYSLLTYYAWQRSRLLVLPTIIEPDMGSNLIVYESCSVVVACVAEGAPPPTVTWYHAGVKVDSLCVSTLDESRPGVGRTKCRLKWEAVSGAAAGMYRCVAVNIAGSASVDKHQSIKRKDIGFCSLDSQFSPRSRSDSKGRDEICREAQRRYLLERPSGAVSLRTDGESVSRRSDLVQGRAASERGRRRRRLHQKEQSSFDRSKRYDVEQRTLRVHGEKRGKRHHSSRRDVDGHRR